MASAPRGRTPPAWRGSASTASSTILRPRRTSTWPPSSSPAAPAARSASRIRTTSTGRRRSAQDLGILFGLLRIRALADEGRHAVAQAHADDVSGLDLVGGDEPRERRHQQALAGAPHRPRPELRIGALGLELVEVCWRI